MLRIRTLGSTLMVVLALAAVAASAASAAKPEWKGPFPKLFTGSAGGGGIKFTFNEQSVNCLSVVEEGEITAAKIGTMIARFKRCSTPARSCQSPGANEGEIVTYLLSMRLAYINKKTKAVGVSFVGTGGSEGFLWELSCPSYLYSFKIKGGVIGSITGINTASDEFLADFSEEAGKEAVEKFEGEAKLTPLSSYDGGEYGNGAMIVEDTFLTGAVTEIIA